MSARHSLDSAARNGDTVVQLPFIAVMVARRASARVAHPAIPPSAEHQARRPRQHLHLSRSVGSTGANGSGSCKENVRWREEGG